MRVREREGKWTGKESGDADSEKMCEKRELGGFARLFIWERFPHSTQLFKERRFVRKLGRIVSVFIHSTLRNLTKKF